MAGMMIPGQRYRDPSTGRYGTAQEHAAYKKQQRYQEPYNQSAPSAGAAGRAAQQANTNLDYTISPTGDVGYNNQTQQQLRIQQEQAKLAAATAARQRQQEIADRSYKAAERGKLFDRFESFGGGPSAPVTHPGIDTGREADARAAAFSRAKDQAGKLARASLTSIAEEMAGRGISGSGIEALRAAGGIGEAADPLQELTRTQAISDANRAANISDLSYQGGITQRGQDLANRQSYLALLRSLY